MKIRLKISLIHCFGAALAVSSAVAQTPDAAVWRPNGGSIAHRPSPIPQFIQQDMFSQQEVGRNRDMDRMPPGSRMHRDEDDDRDEAGGGGRAQGHPGMRPPMGGMMGLGGARFQMRKGDAAIDVRCPSDSSLNDCVEAIGRMLDRLGAMGSGGAPASR